MTEPSITTANAAPAAVTPSLNDFPDDILVYILSFLPTKSVIRTSLVSRKWRNLWSQVSSLNFPYSTTATAAASAGGNVTRRSFADFISQTLLQRHQDSPLRSFYLEFDFKDPIFSFQVDSWLRYAIHRHVQEIELNFFINTQLQSGNFPENELVYGFPFFLLRNGCVNVLRLSKCDIIAPYNMASMGLKSLGSVFLDQVCLSDQMVSNLVSGCVNLECLSLEYCYGMKDLKICSLKLKHLHLNYFNGDNGSLEICCTNLVSLEMIGFEVDKYKLEDLSSLVEASVFFLHKLEYYGHWSQVMRSVAHVRCLTVQNWWFKFLAMKPAFSGRSLLKNLKHLELRTEYSKSDLLGLAALLVFSPSLETMVLDYLCKIDEDESLPEELSNKPIDFVLPSLRQVKIKDFRATENGAILLTHLILHGEVLEKIILVPPAVAETVVRPTILQRQLKRVKFSVGQVPKLKFKYVGGAIGIFMEE